MNSKGAILILFAWVMEAVGVAGGIINSTYTTFGENLPNSFAGYLPAVPMFALAVAEFGRVPLASVIFHKHKFMQVIAIVGVVALGYLAAENWTFGFERIVDLRPQDSEHCESRTVACRCRSCNLARASQANDHNR